LLRTTRGRGFTVWFGTWLQFANILEMVRPPKDLNSTTFASPIEYALSPVPVRVVNQKRPMSLWGVSDAIVVRDEY